MPAAETGFLAPAETEAGATRGARTRARLLRAAAEVVDQGGYAAASVAAIAERAGVSTGALYRHYPSKAELFVELFRHAADHQLREMRAAAADQARFAEKLAAVLATYAGGALARPSLTWALVYEPVDPLVDEARLASRQRYSTEMSRLIREGVAAGEFPPQDAQLTAAGVVGALAEALVGPLSRRAATRESDDEAVRGIVGFCLRAVGAPAA